MSENHFLLSAVIFLVAAVVSVPISKKLGLGSVLGYLIAGAILGPWGLALISEVEDLLHFSELGVVLFMFLIGLELDVKKLWSLRTSIFGTGGLQMFLSFALIFVLFLSMGWSWPLSLLVAFAFSLSSTALALQILREKNILNTSSGQSAFSVLLFQDLAVIPMLTILPFLAGGSPQGSWQEMLGPVLKAVFIIVAVFAAGRFLLRRALDWIASIHLREIFTALALLLVFSAALLMESLQLSMALGAFLAGVLLADSEYRTALETDIEPFKGLLLGLFFMSVGMSIDFQSIQQQPFAVFGTVAAVVLIKIAVLVFLGKIFQVPKSQVPLYAVALSQIGEFAFVLLGTAQSLKLMENSQVGFAMAVTAVSMLSTPLLSLGVEKWFSFSKKDPSPDRIENEENPVIIAGFGRFGQIIGRFLYAHKIKATVLDYEPAQIELLRRFGFKIYFGDATRLDLLEAAGAGKAQVLVVAIDDVDDNLKLIDLAQQHFPHLKIFARARNVRHVYELMERKIHGFERETFESSLKLAVEILRDRGWPAHQAHLSAQKFRLHNQQMLRDLQPARNNQDELVAKAQQARLDIEKMFEEDSELFKTSEPGW